MGTKDIERPMQSGCQLVSYAIINGNANYHSYFAECNSQDEIEQHRSKLLKKHNLSDDYKICFALRQLPNAGFVC